MKPPKKPKKETTKKLALPPEEVTQDMLEKFNNSALVRPSVKEDKAEMNRAAAWFVLKCLENGRNTDISNIDSLYDSLGKYVELCTQSGMPMLIKTCCLALGIHDTTLTAWRNGKNRSSDPRFKQFAILVGDVVGAGMQASAAAGAIDRVLTIWWEKAHFNMTEGTGREENVTDPLGEVVSGEDIIKKYSDLPD